MQAAKIITIRISIIIDVHAHPLLFDVINENPEDLNFRKQEFGVFKSGINPVDFEMTLLGRMRRLIKWFSYRRTILQSPGVRL